MVAEQNGTGRNAPFLRHLDDGLGGEERAAGAA